MERDKDAALLARMMWLLYLHREPRWSYKGYIWYHVDIANNHCNPSNGYICYHVDIANNHCNPSNGYICYHVDIASNTAIHVLSPKEDG